MGGPQGQPPRVRDGAPWKKAGLSRKQFEELLAMLPEGFVEQIHLEADAERLIAAAFGADPD